MQAYSCGCLGTDGRVNLDGGNHFTFQPLKTGDTIRLTLNTNDRFQFNFHSIYFFPSTLLPKKK